MFGRFTYLGYVLLFTVPFIVFLFLRGRSAIKKHLGTIVAVTVFCTAYGAFFLWPIGLRIETWQYNSEKMLGVLVFGAHLEDILWWLATVFLFSAFIAVSSDREEAGRSFITEELRGFLRSMHHACSGLARFFEERNLAIMAFCGVGAVITALFAGMLFWAALISFATFIVLAIEMINSALESLADAVMFEPHPLVRKAKDTMAAASTLASFGALLVGMLFLRALFF